VLDVGDGRLHQQDSLAEVERNRVVNDAKDRPIDCLNACHRVIADLLIADNPRVVVLSLALDSIHLILLDLIEGD